MFDYKTTSGSAPLYLNSVLQTYLEAYVLQVNDALLLSQRETKSLSQTFAWTVPSWWNNLPNSTRE